MLGCVAAVMAIVSPSQLRPALIQSTSISWIAGGVLASGYTFHSGFYSLRAGYALNLSSASHQPQQAKEQVDEVQVESQSAEDRCLAAGIGALASRGVHSLDLLSIVGSKSRENDDADDREHEAGARTHQPWKDHGQQTKADQSEQAHHAEGAHRPEVPLGREAKAAEARKPKGRDTENCRYAG